MLSKKPARERPWLAWHDFSSKATTGNMKESNAAVLREIYFFPVRKFIYVLGGNEKK